MKIGIVLGASLLAGTVCFADGVSATSSNAPHDGLFLGLGGNYNSANLTQNSWGEGISNIRTSTGANSNGIGQGNGAPFHNTNNTLGPSFQAGYLKHIGDTSNLFGVKFFYQYLDSTATNANLYIPQLGQSTSAITGVTTPLYGYVNSASVQTLVNQQVTLLMFGGHSFDNASLYFGVGPSLVNIQSKNFNSIGYANFEGATINVTGLVSYSTPAFWAWGATAQMGATYFFSPTWFLDIAYTYTLTPNHTSNYQQTFTNSSSVGSTAYTTSGTLYTKDTVNVKNQSIMLTINKVFDL